MAIKNYGKVILTFRQIIINKIFDIVHFCKINKAVVMIRIPETE